MKSSALTLNLKMKPINWSITLLTDEIHWFYQNNNNSN